MISPTPRREPQGPGRVRRAAGRARPSGSTTPIVEPEGNGVERLFDPADYGIPEPTVKRTRVKQVAHSMLIAPPWVVLRRIGDAPHAHLPRRELPDKVVLAPGARMALCGKFGTVLDIDAGTAVPVCPKCWRERAKVGVVK